MLDYDSRVCFSRSIRTFNPVVPNILIRIIRAKGFGKEPDCSDHIVVDNIATPEVRISAVRTDINNRFITRSKFNKRIILVCHLIHLQERDQRHLTTFFRCSK